MRLTVIGPVEHAVPTAAAAARSGVEVEVIAWLDPSQAAAALPLKDYPVNLHVLEAPEETTFVLSRSVFNTAAELAIEESDAVVLATGALGMAEQDFFQWIADEHGIAITAMIGAHEIESPNLRFISTVCLPKSELASFERSGESDLSLARQVHEHGPNLIAIVSSVGASFVYAADTNEGFDTFAELLPGMFVDGYTDTFLGALAARSLQTDSPLGSAQYAAMAAELQRAYPGPLRETAEEIERQLQERLEH